jgi:hypothetical protein
LSKWSGCNLAIFPGLVSWIIESKNAPVVVSRAATQNTFAANPDVVSLPGSLVSGNLLIVWFGYYSASAWTMTTPSGWSLLTSRTTTPGGIGYVFYKTSSGSEGSTLGVTCSGTTSNAGWGAIAWQISGWSGTPQFGTFATGTSASPNPPSVTPTSAASLVLALCSGGNIGSTETISSYPAGYSNGQIGAITSSSNRGFAAAAELTKSGTSAEDPGTFSLGTSAAWLAQTLIVNA